MWFTQKYVNSDWGLTHATQDASCGTPVSAPLSGQPPVRLTGPNSVITHLTQPTIFSCSGPTWNAQKSVLPGATTDNTPMLWAQVVAPVAGMSTCSCALLRLRPWSRLHHHPLAPATNSVSKIFHPKFLKKYFHVMLRQLLLRLILNSNTHSPILFLIFRILLETFWLINGFAVLYHAMDLAKCVTSLIQTVHWCMSGGISWDTLQYGDIIFWDTLSEDTGTGWGAVATSLM